MPEVIEPLSFINLSGGVIVVGAHAMPEVVFEGALIMVAIGVVHGSLEGSGGVEIVAFEPFSSGEEEWLLHGLHSYLCLK